MEMNVIKITRNTSEIDAVLEKNSNNSNRLIPILQQVQEVYSYLPKDVLEYIAFKLGIPEAKLYGVATFYAHFSLKPKGKNIIKVCDGTACHVKKAGLLIDTIREKLSLTKEKNTTDDLLFTLDAVSCLGACGLAPVVVVNHKVYGQVSTEKMVKIIEEIKEKKNECE